MTEIGDRSASVEEIALQSLGFAVKVGGTPADGACFSHSLCQWVRALPQEERCRINNVDTLVQRRWDPGHWAMCFKSFCVDNYGLIRDRFVGGFGEDVYRRALQHYAKRWKGFSDNGVLIDPRKEGGGFYSVFDDMPFLAAAFHGINITVVVTEDGSKGAMNFPALEPTDALHAILGRINLNTGAPHYVVLWPQGTRGAFGARL